MRVFGILLLTFMVVLNSVDSSTPGRSRKDKNKAPSDLDLNLRVGPPGLQNSERDALDLRKRKPGRKLKHLKLVEDVGNSELIRRRSNPNVEEDREQMPQSKKKPGPKKIPSTSVNPDPMLPNPLAPYNHGPHYLGPQYPVPQYPIPHFPVPHYPVYLYPVHPYPVHHPQGYQNPGSQYPPHYEGGLHLGPSSAYAGNMAHPPPEGYSDDNFSGKGASSGFNSPGK